MKVLLLIQSTDASLPGPEGFMADWVEALGRRVDHLTVLTFHLPKKNYPKNIEFYQIKGSNFVTRTINIMAKILSLTRTQNYDAYFAHIIEQFAVIMGIIGLIIRIKTVFWYCQGYDLSRNFRAKLAFLCIDKVITCSNFVKQRYIKEVGFWAANKIKVVGHGVNLKHYSKANPIPWPKNKESVVILNAGRTSSPIKDSPTLERAVADLSQKNYPVKLAVSGSYPYEENYKIFSQGNIFVNPSQSKAIDKTLLESLACGVIAIGTNFTYPFLEAELPELVFQAGDSRELSRKIAFLLDHPDKRVILLNKAKKYIQKNFSLELLMDKIVLELSR